MHGAWSQSLRKFDHYYFTKLQLLTDHPMRVSSTKRPQRRAAAASNSISQAAFPIFVTLVVLNITVFVVLCVFLPTQKHDDRFFSVPRSQKKKHHRPDPSAEALRQALYNTTDKVIPYDTVPKILHQSDSFHGVVHQLPSIPDRRRMIPNTSPKNGEPYVPSDAVKNLEYFLDSRERENEEDQPLYLYNPMLLPLDDKVIDSTILDDLSIDQNHAAYVGVYRVSNFGKSLIVLLVLSFFFLSNTPHNTLRSSQLPRPREGVATNLCKLFGTRIT
jgi:hypothetical protein